MKTQIELVSAAVFLDGVMVGTVDGLADVDLTALEGASFTPAGAAQSSASTPSYSQTFAEGTTVSFEGERYAGTGYVETYKGDDLILRLTDVTRQPDDAPEANAKGRRLRVYAQDINAQVSEYVPEAPTERPGAVTVAQATDDSPAPTAPEGYEAFTGNVRDLDTEGTQFYLSGVNNEGVVTVLAHKRRARPSEKVYGQIASEVRSHRQNVKVSVTQADVTAGRIFTPLAAEEEDFEHTDDNAIFSAADAPVGTRVSWIGTLAEGFGGVVAPNSRNPKGVLSIRINNERNNDQPIRLALGQADLDAGNLARYDR